MIRKVFWARNVECVFNRILCSRDCKQVTGLFEIVEDGGIKDKVEEEKKNNKKSQCKCFWINKRCRSGCNEWCR